MVIKRKKIRLRYKKERVVFSDVLPYELPLIFSNRYFYRFLVRNGIWIEISREGQDTLHWNKTEDKGILGLLAIIFCRKISEFEGKDSLLLNIHDLKRIPFVYSIQHKPLKHRFLSLIHPANQIKVVDLYNRYKDAIIYLCSKSNFSIRYPSKVACYFYYKDRLHHVLMGKKTDKMEMYFNEYENLKTFFSYKRYTNIYKFYEDYRYQRAEKKFSRLLKMDVQNCFDSIYTHSIAWAINGGVDIYKDTFEGKCDGSVGVLWDKMMQEMNYNETNGIVIGPECSRIFAEVIMQYVDQMVEQQLLIKGYRNKVDYECYRYVDDYFFFYNSEAVKVDAEQLFQMYLKEFKLSLSQEKNKTFERPFVTEITKAKIAIDDLLNNTVKLYTNEPESELSLEEEMEQTEQDMSQEAEEPLLKVDRPKVTDCLATDVYFCLNATDFNKRFKVLVSANSVDPKDVLNYTIARLAIRLERALKKFDRYYKTLCLAIVEPELVDLYSQVEKKRKQLEKDLSKYLFNILDSVFFLYANSKRINTTLKVMQILNIIWIYLDNDYSLEVGKKKSMVRRFTEYAREIVFKKIRDEISVVLQTAPMDEHVQLETLYFLLILRSMNGKYHLSRPEMEKYLKIGYNEDGTVKTLPKLNMLAVTILIYYFGNAKQFVDLKDIIVNHTLKRINEIPANRRRISAEYIIFALDMAACPYIKPSMRVKYLQSVGASRTEGAQVLKYMKQQKYMFTKWTGVDITKELNAKISQEVYS
ncbi:RNA-directed DNA polymerase [Parabacteroides distasonis]|uniref:antiviral reverse transcriptase Drt3b n=1 Tax=Parabacteroides distasonis TaxID=823 RepID=UPI0021645281|nr:antiviral reverse transcriptase Drt3b [Parabacteroides distasonis]UVR25552.1 RNA-directed DNA polymerase [Parabacteroides distasonis]